MNNRPLVTINILSFNRKNDLHNTLSKVYEQDYKNIEVIVVDNSSTDGSPEMVKEKFPNVHLIRLNKNIGIAGWNEGFRVAKGDFILVLDDDSYPANGAIDLGVKTLKSDEKIAVAALNVYNIKLKVYETKDFLDRPYFFNGCGAIIKKEIFDFFGYFNEMIFIYYHEFDFSTRVYNYGYDIIYVEDALIIHNQSSLSRGYRNNEDNPFKSEYRFYHYFISRSIILIQCFSWYYIVIFLPKWILNRLIVCIYNNYYKTFMKAVGYLIRYSVRIITDRKVLRKEIQKFYSYGNEALIDRTYFPNFKKPRIVR